MRKNERARLERRADYQAARQRATERARPYTIRLSDEASVQEFNRNQALSTAYHEAGHAIAAWMQGVKSSMRYVESGLTMGRDLSGVTSSSDVLSPFISGNGKSASVTRGTISNAAGQTIGVINDAGVTAFRQTFITLAGPFAQLLGPSLPEAAYHHIFQTHGDEARDKLMAFSDLPVEDLKSALARLLDLTRRTFQEPRVVACVHALAHRFHMARTLSQGEVQETIDAAWSEFRPEGPGS